MPDLRRAITWSRERLRPYRVNRYDAILQYVGKHYGEGGTRSRVPINLIELATSIYTMQLVAETPSALVTTKHKQLKPYAYDLELALNHLSHEIKLGLELEQVVHNSMFSMGIIKHGMELTGAATNHGIWANVDQPFAASVELEDWVHDMGATRFDKVQYKGNRYRLPLDIVQEFSLFDKTARNKLHATQKVAYDEQGDEKLSTMFAGGQVDPDEFVPHVELWDIYLPLEKLLVTFPCEGDDESPPLRVVEWDGPEGGPYKELYYNTVPGQCMPIPPVAYWLDNHELVNTIMLKLGDQVQRQKTVLGVAGAATEDGNRVIVADDGDAIRLDSPESMKEYSFGGPDQMSLGFMIQLKDIFSYMAGNLDALGGLSTQADTATQDQLLHMSSAKRIASMQKKTIEFTSEVMSGLAHYLWHDPLIQIPITRRVQGTDIEIPGVFSAEDREGDFLEYNIKIHPFSMTHVTPAQKLQTLTQVFQTFVVPFAEQLQAQGTEVNFESLLRIIGKYANMDELDSVLNFYGPGSIPGPVGKPSGAANRPPRAPVTRHISERRNIPGASRQGKDEALAQMLMGGNTQRAQKASLVR